MKSWLRTSSGLQLLASHTMAGVAGVLEVDVAAARNLSFLRFVTVVQPSVGDMVIGHWQINPTTGKFSHLGSNSPHFAGSSISIVPTRIEGPANEIFPQTIYAVAAKVNNQLRIVYQKVLWNGGVDVTPPAVTTAGGFLSVELASLGSSGLVSAVRLSDKTLKIIVWENRLVANNPNPPLIQAVRVSDHATTVSGADVQICSTPTSTAEGDYITSMREGTTGVLKIRGWRIGDKPFAIPGG
jgi:hypothetical protein